MGLQLGLVVKQLILYYSEGQCTAFSFDSVSFETHFHWLLWALPGISNLSMQLLPLLSLVLTLCINDHFSVFPFICSLFASKHIGEKNTNEKSLNQQTLELKIWGSLKLFPVQQFPNLYQQNKSGGHQHSLFSLHATRSHCEGGKCIWFSGTLCFRTTPCVLGAFPAVRMRQYCRGVVKNKKITTCLSSNTTECYRNTWRMSQHRFLWTQRVLNFLQKSFGRRVTGQS